MWLRDSSCSHVAEAGLIQAFRTVGTASDDVAVVVVLPVVGYRRIVVRATSHRVF